MQTIISAGKENGFVSASEWVHIKSRHRKILGIPTPIPSSPLQFRGKKRIPGRTSGDSTSEHAGVLSSFNNQRQVKASIKQRSLFLPTTSYFSNNHVMINNDRVANMRRPLIRRRNLDELARAHALSMAKKDHTFYSDPLSLLERSSEKHLQDFNQLRMGQSVIVSANLRDAHLAIRESKYDRRNMLYEKWTHFGTGSAPSTDGAKLYVCYMFECTSTL
mmetsp:Transcript_1817/g.4288  ORF Transcript_1817/g.4288 Transcript_1817/m.4288 type:complete len:219 (-) Transcript_1817:177-833(-)|eukprot:CAMPEP_0178488508 /NCGR_PEP_ID=MMETSP0696-20121128/9894_1 /TAXON_ID=265572 /ORGANISM="Extubocellulus spinifer, Strain CCMP396" /LENGTH=218 /DNA_ID=CAMNT_0020116275 /DNA_START=42 /DNA_END=698 /DNA_ORIENTATION=+